MPSTDPVTGDVTMAALQSALDGLAARQRATAANIANVQTPGYRAEQVDFETALRSALTSGGDPTSATATTSLSTAPTRTDGNNVNIQDETVSMEQTGLRYQFAIEAMNAKFSLLRTAIGA